ncbi:molecular chaperone DnaJ [Candidatus Woesearchaeota archaeon]|nr:molecular chaperone DnaJ [Candidatus Woesearchaeota archaeon]
MAGTKDYYQILGVNKNAAKEEIKRAYKKLALKYHPDRAPEDKKKEYEEKFKEINEAASILGDDKKRQQYDQFGSSAFQGGSGAHPGFDFSDIMSQFRSGAFGNFEDIFDQLFSGGQTRSSRARRGSDLLYELEVTLEEVAEGTSKTIHLNKLENCEKCRGKGAQQFEKCPHCQGSGYLKRVERTVFGIFQQTGPCPYCHGKGELPQDSCPACGGEGLVRKRKELAVKIPPGVEEGMKLRVPGEGEAGERSGSNGDLYVEIQVKEHPIFTREGEDIQIKIPISFTQAVLGDEIEVPIINGSARLKIPPGTQSETILRMREKGLPAVNSPRRGDQLVAVRIEVPDKLSKKQIDLIKQLHEEKPMKSFLKMMFG